MLPENIAISVNDLCRCCCRDSRFKPCIRWYLRSHFFCLQAWSRLSSTSQTLLAAIWYSLSITLELLLEILVVGYIDWWWGMIIIYDYRFLVIIMIIIFICHPYYCSNCYCILEKVVLNIFSSIFIVITNALVFMTCIWINITGAAARAHEGHRLGLRHPR